MFIMRFFFSNPPMIRSKASWNSVMPTASVSMRTGSGLALFVLALLFIVPGAYAQVLDLTVSVDGMACPFCAFGVEKKLRGVDGADTIDISMKDGTATITALEGRSVAVGQVPGAIRDAGFSPGTIRISARGGIAADGKSLYLQADGQRFLLSGVEGSLKEQVKAAQERGGSVVLHGIVRERSGGEWTLTPESVGEEMP
jgi:mercuric ion binding protein